MNTIDWVLKDKQQQQQKTFRKKDVFISFVPIICNGLFQIILIMGTDAEKQLATIAYGRHFRINLPYGPRQKIDCNPSKKKKKKTKISKFILFYYNTYCLGKYFYRKKWVFVVWTPVKNWLVFEISVPTMCCRGKACLYQSLQKQYHGSKAKLKKSWQHQLITKPLAAKVLLVKAAWTRAAEAPGWLFKAVGGLDKLKKMSWCHVAILSYEPTSGGKETCYCREFLNRHVVGCWAVCWRENWMEDSTALTVKFFQVHFCRKIRWSIYT